jgi:hypothetical protein
VPCIYPAPQPQSKHQFLVFELQMWCLEFGIIHGGIKEYLQNNSD